MLSAFIVSERPFAFHCGPDLGGKQYKESETSCGIHIGKSDIPFVDSSIIESTALV
jgi:hypothetical protein